MTVGSQIDELKRAYQMLDVPSSASPDDIKKAYRRITKRWHPDRYRSGTPAHTEATQMMKQINEAYSSIADAPLQHVHQPRPQHEPTYPSGRGPIYSTRHRPATEEYESYQWSYSEPLETGPGRNGRFHYWICFALGCAYGSMAAAFCMGLFPTHPVVAIIRSIALVLGGGYFYALWKR